MTTSPQNDPVLVEAASALLTEMKGVSVSLVYAAFLTDDGFDVARLPSRVTDGPRFASMARASAIASRSPRFSRR